MSDWNPSEIIGNDPNFLGCDSLSEILITKQKANGNCVKFVTNSNN